MALQYKTPTVDHRWADSRQTHPAVAMAIHAIASANRSPETIWEAPTQEEIDHVTMAVENYIANGVFEPSINGRYEWGSETVVVPQ